MWTPEQYSDYVKRIHSAQLVTPKVKTQIDQMSESIFGIPSNWQVGDYLPNRGPRPFKRLGQTVRHGFLEAPNSILGGLLQLTLGFALGLRFAMWATTMRSRVMFYVATQAALGTKQSYLLGGIHLGVIMGGPGDYGIGKVVKRTLEREVLRQGFKRISDKPRWQMPEATGAPGTSWLAPFISSGLWLGSTIGGGIIGWLLGSKDDAPAAPPPMTSLSPTASQFTAPLAAWMRTGNPIWGALLGGVIIGRLLSDHD
jgi:hypothetical protein